MCQYAKKTVELIFEIMPLKFFGKFFEILHLVLVSAAAAAAAELSRLRGLTRT